MNNAHVESWRAVCRWSRHYEISDLGRVRSLDHQDRLGRQRCGRILRGCVEKSHGYCKVNLSAAGRHRHAYVHHLVAETYLGMRPPGYMINHIDGNKTNNRVSNLEYVLPADNIRHAFRTGLNHGGSGPGMANPYAKLTDDQVRSIRGTATHIDGVTCARLFEVSTSTVSMIRRGQSWRHLDKPQEIHDPCLS